VVAIPHAAKRPRRVLEHIAVWRVQGETQAAMRIVGALDEAGGRIASEGDPFDRREIARAVALAGAWRADRARRRDGAGDPFRRRRVLRENVRSVGRLLLRVERRELLGRSAERGQKAGGAIGIVARGGNDLDPYRVGLELLLP